MATVIRKTEPTRLHLANAINDLKAFVMAQLRLAEADLVSIAADSVAFATPALADSGAHNDKSETTVAAANGDGTLATALTLVNELIGVYTFHMADVLAHKVTGVALASIVRATSLATAITRANDIKAKYETHRASTTYHYTADSSNTISASNATDQASLDTLLNELKGDFNLHMASGPTAKSIRLIDA